MNEVPARPGGAADRPDDEARDDARGAQPGLASIDQRAIRPSRRRFGEALASSGPNEQSSTAMRVARPSDPGVTPGTDDAPPGDAEVEVRDRGAPGLAALGDDAARHATAEPGRGD
jgi:hypothetical protein